MNDLITLLHISIHPPIKILVVDIRKRKCGFTLWNPGFAAAKGFMAHYYQVIFAVVGDQNMVVSFITELGETLIIRANHR